MLGNRKVTNEYFSCFNGLESRSYGLFRERQEVRANAARARDADSSPYFVEIWADMNQLTAQSISSISRQLRQRIPKLLPLPVFWNPHASPLAHGGQYSKGI